jgi:hypothetical protein
MNLCVNHVVAEMCKPLARYATFTFTFTSTFTLEALNEYPIALLVSERADPLTANTQLARGSTNEQPRLYLDGRSWAPYRRDQGATLSWLLA